MSVSKEALRSYGNRLVGDLQVYLRSLHTHDVNNAIIVRARNALFRTLEEHFEEEPDTALHVQLLPEETFINGTLLPVAMADFGRILELTGQLRRQIQFISGIQNTIPKAADFHYISNHAWKLPYVANHCIGTEAWPKNPLRMRTHSEVGQTGSGEKRLCIPRCTRPIRPFDATRRLEVEGKCN